MTEDEKAVAEANQAFYEAFENRDLAAMTAVWEQSERATCTHPGWPMLRGWGQVQASFSTMFERTPFIQFFLTDQKVQVHGDVAWVIVEENVLQAHQTHGGHVAESLLGDATAEAVNLFVRHIGERGDAWRLVVHHASAVTGMEEDTPPLEPPFNN